MNIEFQELSKKYNGKYALENFSAVLETGVYGLLGANGAGKTTLINLFVGILKSDGGEVLVDGVNARTLGREFLSWVGYMPQYPLFYKDFTVKDFLGYMCALKGLPAKQGMARAEELLEIVNLSGAASQKIGALSGGMRQRVGIVQAMLGDPRILILDEPTAGLDPQERIRFRNLITRFAEGRTVLLATHIVSDVEFIAGQVLILKKGRLIKQDTTASLEQEIEGKVWSVSLPEGSSIEHFEAYPISNMQRSENQVNLRLLAEEQPDPSARTVCPNLEDVFLYHFGGGAPCSD